MGMDKAIKLVRNMNIATKPSSWLNLVFFFFFFVCFCFFVVLNFSLFLYPSLCLLPAHFCDILFCFPIHLNCTLLFLLSKPRALFSFVYIIFLPFFLSFCNSFFFFFHLFLLPSFHISVTLFLSFAFFLYVSFSLSFVQLNGLINYFVDH